MSPQVAAARLLAPPAAAGAVRPRLVHFYKSLVRAGGAERQFIEECRYSEARGAEVHVLAYAVEPEALFGWPSERVEVVRGRSAERIWSLSRRMSEVGADAVLVADGILDVYLATRLSRVPYFYHHNSPILLYSEHPNLTPYSVLHARAFPRLRQRYFGSMQFVPSHWPFGLGARLAMEPRALLSILALRAARLVVTPSHRTREELKLVYGIDAAVRRGCLDDALFAYAPRQDVKRRLGIAGQRMILNVNRLTVEKRVDVLVESFAAVARERADVVLVIGGIGPERPRLEALIAQHGIADRVRLVGFIPDEDLWDYYAACDVFAGPAWADFIITTYEALALGAKVVWSTEMEPWEGELESGRVFPADPFPKPFAAGLLRALDSGPGTLPDLRKYRWEHKFRETYELCERLARGARRRAGAPRR